MLDHATAELQLIQRVRDEAHRCAITHHRALRDKAFTASVLEEISGIGPKRRKALLKHFGSVKAIKKATAEELQAVEGITKANVEAILAWAEEKQKGKAAVE